MLSLVVFASVGHEKIIQVANEPAAATQLQQFLWALDDTHHWAMLPNTNKCYLAVNVIYLGYLTVKNAI